MGIRPVNHVLEKSVYDVPGRSGHELKPTSRARVAMWEIPKRPLVLVMVSECGRNGIAGFETCSQES